MNALPTTRFQFVAILGAPNAGKSTLINRLVGTKVSIVSRKVQTTRSRVLGIVIRDLSQIVFIDTPGIFKPKRRLDRAMVASAWEGAHDSDINVLLVDSEICTRKGIDQDTKRIIDGLSYGPKVKKNKSILVINKVDVADKQKLLLLSQSLNETGIFTKTFMLSAKTGNGVDDFMGFLADNAPEGPWHYPEDQITDMPERLLAAEITREQIYHQLHQELPYAAHVETESWEELEDGGIKVNQVIFVERPGQKGIVLGKGGAKIKSIGEAARRELTELLGCPVHLFLFVKVRGDWGDDPDRYRDFGLDYNA